MMILKRILKEQDTEGVDLTHLAQDGDHWRAFVNTVMNSRVSRNAQNFLIR
jgi:hypothetical protein